MIHENLFKLANFYINKGYMSREDAPYALNQVMDILELSYLDDFELDKEINSISEALDNVIDFACLKGIINPPSVLQKDIFTAKILNCFLPRPSEVNNRFETLLFNDSKKATDYFYDLSVASNYIKLDRVSKNITWTTTTEYGNIDCTINLSKPEKDPRDIMAASINTDKKYPKCLLCKENVGYHGAPGRANHRIVPIQLNNERFYLQYSPYVYYNQHAIVIKENHVPMNIDHDTFKRLLDFVDIFPHYFLGSNAGLPIVGGSILSHEHYQGGMSGMPIEQATGELIGKIDEVTVQRLHWPIATVRLQSEDRQCLIDVATKLYFFWKDYSNEDVGVYSYTDQPHNSITPMARKQGNVYTLDLVLRNNRISDEHPLGIFHSHEEHHHIKKENIGIIEVQGLTILPARLKEELYHIEKYIVSDIPLPESCSLHEIWAEEIKKKYKGENVTTYIQDEVTLKTVQILENASVFKRDRIGQEAFSQFLGGFLDVRNK